MTRLAALLALGLAASAHSFSSLPRHDATETAVQLRDLFELWKERTYISYASTDIEDAAFATWSAHHEMIEAHNADATQSYQLKHTQFSDMTTEDHAAVHLGWNDVAVDDASRRLAEARVFKPTRRLSEVPASWDWVAEGKVTSIKNQGNCGDCYTFAASAAIESAYAIDNDMPTATLSVSPQQLTSCTNGAMGNNGCDGGNAVATFAYLGGATDSSQAIASNGATLAGLDGGSYTDSSWTLTDGTTVSTSRICTCEQYPFTSGVGQAGYASALDADTMCGVNYASPSPPTTTTGDAGTCDTTTVADCASGTSLTVGGFGLVASEDDLVAAVYEHGPVVVAVNADSTAMQHYASGVFDGCTSSVQDHAVLVVGFGTDSSGVDYWKIKNSWGVTWGEDGYWLLKRGVNMCGIGYTAPSSMYTCAYPTGVSGAGFPPPTPPEPPPPPASTEPYGNPTTGACASDTTNLNENYVHNGLTYGSASGLFGGNTIPCAPQCGSGCPTFSGATAIAQCTIGGSFCGLLCYDTQAACPSGMSCYGQGASSYGTCVFE